MKKQPNSNNRHARRHDAAILRKLLRAEEVKSASLERGYDLMKERITALEAQVAAYEGVVFALVENAQEYDIVDGVTGEVSRYKCSIKDVWNEYQR